MTQFFKYLSEKQSRYAASSFAPCCQHNLSLTRLGCNQQSLCKRPAAHRNSKFSKQVINEIKSGLLFNHVYYSMSVKPSLTLIRLHIHILQDAGNQEQHLCVAKHTSNSSKLWIFQITLNRYYLLCLTTDYTLIYQLKFAYLVI